MSRVCVLCRRQPAQAPWLPFCSERCKLEDLSHWVDGRYRVAAERVDDDSVPDAGDAAEETAKTDD